MILLSAAAKAVIRSTFVTSMFPVLPATLEFIQRYRAHDFPVYLDYPIRPLPRYGWGAIPHALLYSLIDDNRDAYMSLIRNFVLYKNGLQVIPQEKSEEPSSPYWSNLWVDGIDAVSLYAFPHLFRSNLYIEIGSGVSTRFVRKSINDNRLNTKIISIDPQPREEIDFLCDSVVRSPVEDIDIALFDNLQSGDILMIDNSHRCFQNSDVTMVFLDILPRLKAGVIIYVDDIYLPCDYPSDPKWSTRYYSEQYLLGVMLLADAGRRYEIILPGWFVSTDRDLRKLVEASWREIGIGSRNPIEGTGFWMRVKADNEIVPRVPSVMDNAVREAVEEALFRDSGMTQSVSHLRSRREAMLPWADNLSRSLRSQAS